ncbi:hypothetical protein HUW62_27660 [Myxococcus sp. AM011]|uniref:hypothetical protein n=1 Tax=Myxococcus sp. AM011 TaxID=2745200 RepID=UPI0015953FA4|nr:hypothetical protein [Myxococcus sp. AM011]NVJ25010.1 hypothetical protein [Myxococcus sp. AM011]
MKLFSKSLLVGVAALALSPTSASALPRDCDERCLSTTPCWVVCALPWNTTVVTCGEWFEEWEAGTCAAGAREDIEEELMSIEREEQANASFECTEQQ